MQQHAAAEEEAGAGVPTAEDTAPGQESLQLGEVGAAEEAAGAGEGVESLQLEAAGGVEPLQPKAGGQGEGVEPLQLDKSIISPGEGEDDDGQRKAAAALTIQSHQRGVRDRKAVESRKEAKAHVWTRPSFQAKGAPALVLGEDGVLTLLDESPAHEDQAEVVLQEEGEGEEDFEQRKAAAALTIQSHQRGVRDRKAVESRKEAKAHIWTRPSFQAKGAPALVMGEDGVLTLLDESPAHEDQAEVVLQEEGEGEDDFEKRKADAVLVIQARQRGVRDRPQTPNPNPNPKLQTPSPNPKLYSPLPNPKP